MRFATVFTLSASAGGVLAAGTIVVDYDYPRSTVDLSKISQPTQNPPPLQDSATWSTLKPIPTVTLNAFRFKEAEKLAPRIHGKYMARPLSDAQECIRSRSSECFDMVDIKRAPDTPALRDCMYHIAKQCGYFNKEKRDNNMKSPLARRDDGDFSDAPCLPTCRFIPGKPMHCDGCPPKVAHIVNDSPEDVEPTQDNDAEPTEDEDVKPTQYLPPVLIEPTLITPGLDIDALKKCYEAMVENCRIKENTKDDPENKKAIKCAENIANGCTFDMVADWIH